MRKTLLIFLNSIPVLLMIALIPLMQNDYILSSIYIFIIFVLLLLKRMRNDLLVLFLGLVTMTILEYLFVKTGVETFHRDSLFGIMPLWLPILWAYGFVVIKRVVSIIEK